MPARLRPADPADVDAALEGLRTASSAGEKPDRADLRLLTKHFLALLETRAPGHSVEVRVPPYGAVQAVEGGRHTRGTPRAVVETDAATWIALATGTLVWADAVGTHRVRASGERTDLSGHLPLVPG